MWFWFSDQNQLNKLLFLHRPPGGPAGFLPPVAAVGITPPGDAGGVRDQNSSVRPLADVYLGLGRFGVATLKGPTRLLLLSLLCAGLRRHMHVWTLVNGADEATLKRSWQPPPPPPLAFRNLRRPRLSSPEDADGTMASASADD